MAIFTGTNSNDNFTGTAANDTVTFSGNAAGYEISLVDGKAQVRDIDSSDGDTGTDTLSSIETLSFADKSYGMKSLLVSQHQYGNESNINVTRLANGDYLYSWTGDSANHVYIQRYDANGDAIGKTLRTDCTPLEGSFDRPPQYEISELADGGYAIAWQSDEETISVQRYDAAGNAMGAAAQIDALLSSSDRPFTVTGLASGGYVVTWQPGQTDYENVYAQQFDASGNAVDAVFRVNTGSNRSGAQPQVEALTDGGYLIVWEVYLSDYGHDIHSQRYDAAGNRVGGEILNNQVISGDQSRTSIAATADGGYVMSWTDSDLGADYADIYMRRFDAAGNAVGNQVRVNTDHTGTTRSHSEVVVLDDGGFVIAWNNRYDINAQRYDAAGNKIGAELVIDSDDRNFDAVAMADGGWLVTWNEGTTQKSIHYDENGQALIQQLSLKGTSGADVMNGGSGKLELAGLGGNDKLNGGLHDDTLLGGGGRDVLNGGDGNDVLDGGNGNDTLNGQGGADIFRFSSVLNESSNIDTVRNFSLQGGDTIQLSQEIFFYLDLGKLKAANFRASTDGEAADDNDYILYETDTGKLFYDADGNGAGAKLQFALIGATTHALLAAADFTVV